MRMGLEKARNSHGREFYCDLANGRDGMEPRRALARERHFRTDAVREDRVWRFGESTVGEDLTRRLRD